MDSLRRAKTDYASLKLPNCEYKIAHEVQLGWNWVRDDPAAMRKIAAIFEKVESNLPDLKAYAHRHGQ